jgi:hypothetical protein
MCPKCNELNDKIAHYRRMALYITDQLTLDGIERLIKRMTDEKTAIHHELKTSKSAFESDAEQTGAIDRICNSHGHF